MALGFRPNGDLYGAVWAILGVLAAKAYNNLLGAQSWLSDLSQLPLVCIWQN